MMGEDPTSVERSGRARQRAARGQPVPTDVISEVSALSAPYSFKDTTML